jgi:hypothetical protein
MIIESIPIVFLVAGALVYALSSNAKVAEMGRLAFFAGMLVALFGWAHVGGIRVLP